MTIRLSTSKVNKKKRAAYSAALAYRVFVRNWYLSRDNQTPKYIMTKREPAPMNIQRVRASTSGRTPT